MTTAVVIGRGANVWSELKAAQALGQFDFAVAVNVSGVDYPGEVKHWVTFHVADLNKWVERRAAKGYHLAENYWTSPSQKKLQPKTIWPLQYINVEGGSSGYLATHVALQYAERVVLVGVPMEATGGQYDTNKQWEECWKYQETWERALPKLLGRVRSMSGWTQQKLGAPTQEWLSCSSLVQNV